MFRIELDHTRDWLVHIRRFLYRMYHLCAMDRIGIDTLHALARTAGASDEANARLVKRDLAASQLIYTSRDEPGLSRDRM